MKDGAKRLGRVIPTDDSPLENLKLKGSGVQRVANLVSQTGG
jgi:hypothetical protein